MQVEFSSSVLPSSLSLFSLGSSLSEEGPPLTTDSQGTSMGGACDMRWVTISENGSLIPSCKSSF